MAIIMKKKVKPASTALAIQSSNDPFADAGKGSSNIKASDLIIPRLTILHEMSKATKKSRPEYIKGAQGGMFCITSLQEIFDGQEGVYVAPISFKTRLIEWTPIDEGGGLIRMDVPEEETEGLEMKNAGVFLTDQGTEIVKTPEYYLMMVDLDTGSTKPVVMTLTGKKASAARKWNTLIMAQRRINPATQREVLMPFWFNIYHLTVTAASNEKGDYYLPNVVIHGETLQQDHGEAIYASAKDFYTSVNSGKARAADLSEDEA